jgi:creatinine amidohydrolase
MQLQLTTWPEVESYLEDRTGIILPIGSTEQHGPTGLIGTDALTAELIAQRVGDETGALVAPTIAVGMAQHHMAFPGSMTLKPSTLILVLRDMVVGLARHGFDRFFFINGHGGNITPVNTAFSEIHNELAEGVSLRGKGANRTPAEVHCRLENWYMQPTVAKLAKKLYGDREGHHATPSEVAVTWYAHPDQRRDAPLEELDAVRHGFHGPEDFRRRYPDGRIASDPSLAEPEHGEKLVKAATKALVERYRAFAANSEE